MDTTGANGRYTQSDGVDRNAAGVWCLESHNVTVRDCLFESYRSDGGGTENVIVEGGYIHNSGRDTSKNDPFRAGILISALPTNPSRVRIKGVRCYNDPGTAAQTYGISRDGVVDSYIVDNQLFDNSLGAFGGTADASSIERDNITQ